MVLDILNGNIRLCGPVSPDLAAVLQRAPNSTAQPALPPCPPSPSSPFVSSHRMVMEEEWEKGAEDAMRAAAGWMPAKRHAEGGAASVLRQHAAGSMPSADQQLLGPGQTQMIAGGSSLIRDPVLLAAVVGAVTSLAVVGATLLLMLSFQGFRSMSGRRASARYPSAVDAAVRSAAPATPPATPKAGSMQSAVLPTHQPPGRPLSSHLSSHLSCEGPGSHSSPASHKKQPSSTTHSPSPMRYQVHGVGSPQPAAAGPSGASPAAGLQPGSPAARHIAGLSPQPETSPRSPVSTCVTAWHVPCTCRLQRANMPSHASGA